MLSFSKYNYFQYLCSEYYSQAAAVFLPQTQTNNTDHNVIMKVSCHDTFGGGNGNRKM